MPLLTILIMKRNVILIVLLFSLLGNIRIAFGQETRVSGTIKLHPWISLPVIISTDMKGGLQSLGTIDLKSTPVTVLNTTVPDYKRETGMITSVNDAGNGNLTRYFEYLGSNNWREIFVINEWVAGHGYVTGDYVSYQHNFYVANKPFISDATTFDTDATNWNNAGGANGKYTATELQMDNQTLSKVAVSGTTVASTDLNKTIATVGYVNGQSGGSNLVFNTDRPITLTGTNATGQNLGSGGKTTAEFLQAFFFPSVAATPPTSTFTTTTTSFPYSTWKNWGNPPSSNVSFAWNVVNVSTSDNSDDKAITSIKLKSGATELANVVATGGNQSGTFSSIPFANTVLDPKTTFNKTYTLEVIDAQPNTVTKNLVLTMNAANRLSYGNPSLSPSTAVYEYDISNKSLTLNWNITPNDETISGISVDGSLTGTTTATGSQTVTFKTIANGGTQTKSFPLQVSGNIYGAGANSNTPTVSWDNRLYRGVITSAISPGDPGFTFTDAQVKALAIENKLGGNWKATAGYDFACGAGGQYVVFAYPDDAVTPTVQYFDSNFSSWMTYLPSDLTIINRTNFVNQNGYSGTNYKLIIVGVQYFGTTVKLRLQ
jgi:hypothetical protein